MLKRTFVTLTCLVFLFPIFGYRMHSSAAEERSDISKSYRADEGGFNLVCTSILENGVPVRYSVSRLPSDAISYASFARKPVKTLETSEPQEKIQPTLRNRISAATGSQQETVIVNFRDDLTIPRLPHLIPNEPPDSINNLLIKAQIEQRVAEITTKRVPEYARLSKEFADLYQALVLETFWLIKGILIRVPASAVPSIASRRDVLYVSPKSSGEPPPYVADGRADIASDQYFSTYGTWESIALLDTGVRRTHVTLSTGGQPNFPAYDCFAGDQNCNGGDPGDNCPDHGHGTASACILVGKPNPPLGDPFVV